jgi:glycosyltransferase GT-like protein
MRSNAADQTRVSHAAVTNSSSKFQNRIGVPELVRLVNSAIAEKRGFSLVRLGEGEGTLLARSGDDDSGDLSTKLCEWFGPQHFSNLDLDAIAEMIRAAVASADVLGLPTAAQAEKHAGYRRVFTALEGSDLWRADQPKCDANMHWYLQFSAAIASLLRKRESVGVIGCRDLETELKQTFEIRSIRVLLVRGEEAHQGSVAEPHWPNGFSFVKEQLQGLFPGTIFLIGAGPLGKIYCHMVKANGGIALDIGSLLDSWAGIASRIRYGTFPELFSLEYLKDLNYDDETGHARVARWVSELSLDTTTY